MNLTAHFNQILFTVHYLSNGLDSLDAEHQCQVFGLSKLMIVNIRENIFTPAAALSIPFLKWKIIAFQPSHKLLRSVAEELILK